MHAVLHYKHADLAGHPYAVLSALHCQVQSAYLRQAAKLCRPGEGSDAVVLSVIQVAQDCNPVQGLFQAERPG